ncbi:MAG: hypothetical protein ABIH39_03310 [Candidatus Margulisiibacteriota bacterium]
MKNKKDYSNSQYTGAMFGFQPLRKAGIKPKAYITGTNSSIILKEVRLAQSVNEIIYILNKEHKYLIQELDYLKYVPPKDYAAAIKSVAEELFYNETRKQWNLQQFYASLFNSVILMVGAYR